MTKFEVIVIHTIMAVFLISQHLASSSEQCCNGTMKLIPANDSGSCNVSTYQLLGLHHFGCAQHKEKLLLFILSQANESASLKNGSSCNAGKKQLHVELCENNTWKALCNMSAYYHYLAQGQCTPGNCQYMTDPSWTSATPGNENNTTGIPLPRANDSVSCECDSCCDAGFQEGLCKNNTWEALCNTYTQCHACHHNDCVSKDQSTSIALNPSSTVTVAPGKSILTDKDLVMILSVAIGLLTLLLIVVAIVAITVYNRMRKQNKSLTREIQEYEMISKYSAVRHDSNSLPERYSAIKKRDSNRKQPILPPPHLAADYLTPTMTKTTGSIENPETKSDTKMNQEEKVNTDESKNLDSEAKEETKRNETCNKDSDENPYQSLIVPMANATSVTIDGYVKIIRSRVGSLEGQETPAPKTPPIPPKPEPDYSLKSSIPQLSLASELPPMSENMYASRSGTL